MNPGAKLRRIRYWARHPGVRGGLWALLAASLWLAGSFAYWWPAAQERTAAREAIMQRATRLQHEQQARKVSAVYARALEDVSTLERKLQHAATQAQLVEDLARLAAANGVRVISENYEEGRGKEARSKLNADLVLRGGYPGVHRYLRGLASLRSWSEVSEVAIERGAIAGQVNARVRIMTHRPFATELAAGDSSVPPPNREEEQ